MSASDAPTGYRFPAADRRLAVAPQPIWRCKCGYWIPRNGEVKPPICPYCILDWTRSHKEGMKNPGQFGAIYDRELECYLKPVYGVRMWAAVRAAP